MSLTASHYKHCQMIHKVQDRGTVIWTDNGERLTWRFSEYLPPQPGQVPRDLHNHHLYLGPTFSSKLFPLLDSELCRGLIDPQFANHFGLERVDQLLNLTYVS